MRLAFFPLTDLGNAERFRERYRDKLLWCPAIGWLVWDGKRWSRNGADERVKIAEHECEETTIRRGRKIERRFPLFPGYVFVFMGDTDGNWNRIANIRGVMGSIGALPWDEIDKIRALENQMRPINLEYFGEQEVVGKRRKRWRKR